MRIIVKLKFSTPLFRPAFDHNFLLRKEFHCVHALTVHIAEERFLPSAEREERHRCGHTNIDSNIARFGFISELARGRTAGREQTRLVSISSAVDQFNGFIHAVDVHETQHWPKNFGTGNLASTRGRWKGSSV